MGNASYCLPCAPLALELAVPMDMLAGLGFEGFVAHHPHLPRWVIEFVAGIHEVRMSLRSDVFELEEGPSSTTSPKIQGKPIADARLAGRRRDFFARKIEGRRRIPGLRESGSVPSGNDSTSRP